jgi:ribonuclease HIII
LVKGFQKITDDAINRMAPLLMKQLKYNAISISNERFNQAMKQPAMNMNKIKALCHNKVINNLKAKGYSYDAIVVDAFTPQDRYFEYLKDQSTIARDAILIEKAEDLYYAVGASSIIARYLFLNALSELSSSCGYNLPKELEPRLTR